MTDEPVDIAGATGLENLLVFFPTFAIVSLLLNSIVTSKVLPSFVGSSSCRRQELCRILVDKKTSLSDRNSSFIIDLS